MFDISWTEFLLIGVVALIFIGPKELPAVLRTLGQWTRRIRSMAADFQNQFQEAMREAEMADLKKQVDDIAHDIKSYDPLKDVRADVEAAGKDIQSSLEKPAGESAAQTATTQSETPAIEDAAATTNGSVAAEAVAGLAAPAEPAAPATDYSREAAVVAAAIAPVVPEAVANTPKPDAAGDDPAGRETAGRETAGRQTAGPGE
jgi:sec-independent protein translocase protein TatB